MQHCSLYWHCTSKEVFDLKYVPNCNHGPFCRRNVLKTIHLPTTKLLNFKFIFTNLQKCREPVVAIRYTTYKTRPDGYRTRVFVCPLHVFSKIQNGVTLQGIELWSVRKSVFIPKESPILYNGKMTYFL